MTTSAPVATADPRVAMDTLPMSFAQKLGVANTLLLTATDGFDILAMSFAAPGVTAEWALTRQTLGFIMAMNLIGMGLGSIAMAPLADKFGRRRMVLVALVLIAASMLLSPLAANPVQLGLLRLITGLSIGGMVGPTLALATEYANRRNRTLTASIMSVGLPIGGMLGGMASAWILLHHDWRMIFFFGGSVTIAVGAISWFLLPEAVDFLVLRRDGKSRATLNRILRRYGHDAVPDDFVAPAPEVRKSSYAGLVTPAMRWTTLAMLTVNFTVMVTIYFFMGWLPQIVADMGFSPSDAVTVSVYQNVGGIVGALTLGWAARRYPPIALTVAAMVGTAATVVMLTLMPADLTALRISAALHGFMALATSAGIYGILAAAFPANMRSTGVGVSFGLGRIGTIGATIIPGILFTAGWPTLAVASVMSLGALAAATILFTWNRGRTA